MGFSRQEYWSGVPLPCPPIHVREAHHILGGLAWRHLPWVGLSQGMQLHCRLVAVMHAAAAAAKSLQSCPTLCDPIDGSPPGSSIPGTLQTRTLEWVAISSSNAWKWKVKVKLLSRVQLFATPWTEAYQSPPSMGFSRQEYWSGVPLPSPAVMHKRNLIVETSLVDEIVKESACRKPMFHPWVGKIPWRRKWQPTPVFFPGESHDRGAWQATVLGLQRVGHGWATKHFLSLPERYRWQRICLQCRRPGFDLWVGKIPWRRKWQPTPVFLPGKFHGHRSLVCSRPWGHQELGTTEHIQVPVQ